MKVTLTLNGKSVEIDLTKEQLEALGLKEEKKTGYERAESNKVCWYVAFDGNVDEAPDDRDDVYDLLYKSGNYYSNEQLAEDNARAETLMRKLRRYAAEHGGVRVSTIDNEEADIYSAGYHIFYDIYDKEINVGRVHRFIDVAGIYFVSEEAAKNAIEEFHDELMWYFTEYKPML